MFILFSACKKGPFDYRNKYVGSYDFEYSYLSQSSIDSAIIYVDTSIVYTGEVHKGGEGQLHFDWSNDSFITFDVDKDGNLSLCGKEVGVIDKSKFHILYDDDLCQIGPADTNYFTHVDGFQK